MSNPCPFMTISQNAWILLYVSLKRVQWLLRKLLLFLKYLQGTRASIWVIPNRAAKKLWQYSWCLQCNHLPLNCSPQLPHSVSGEEGKTSKAPLWHDSPNLFYSLNIRHAPKEKKIPLHVTRISLAAVNEGFLSQLTSGRSLTMLPLTPSGSWRQQLPPPQVFGPAEQSQLSDTHVRGAAAPTPLPNRHHLHLPRAGREAQTQVVTGSRFNNVSCEPYIYI